MTDLSSQFLFIGTHDDNGKPANMNNHLGFTNYITTNVGGKGSRMLLWMNGASAPNLASAKSDWNTYCPEGVDATNYLTNPNFSFVNNSLAGNAALDINGKWSAGTDMVVSMRYFTNDCGYDNMLGYMYKGRYYILFPTVKGLNVTNPFMIGMVYSPDNAQTGVNNIATSTDAYRSYQYINTSGHKTVKLGTGNDPSSGQNINFFLINDGWTRWKTGQPITSQHIYFFNNLSGQDAGHAVRIYSARTDVSSTDYQFAILGIEDAHKTNAAANPYGTVSDKDFHDILCGVEFLSSTYAT
jgi:hypothetical protein